MVTETDFGVTNSNLSMFQVAFFYLKMSKFLAWMVWLNLSRMNFLYILIEVILYGIVGDLYMPTSYIIFVIVSYLLILVLEASFYLYFYLKVRSMESAWDQSNIHKISPNSNSWMKTKLKNLKVGDLILLKRNTVTPADVLIVDTSDSHFNDQILYTNERRVTGCNRMTTKRAVKNLRGKNNTKNYFDALKLILPTLEGQLEYEAPSEKVYNFTGTFKLNNDPQISRVSHRNVLFCGTQLHTEWMIGIVLFTGKETKIVQTNLVKWTKFEKFRKEIKITKASYIINWLMMYSFLLSIGITCINILIQFLRPSSLELSNMIETFTSGKAHYLVKFLTIWQTPLYFIPHLAVLVYEVACFIVGMDIQRRSTKERQARIDAANKAIKDATEFKGRKFKRKRSSKLTSETVSSDNSQKRSIYLETGEVIQNFPVRSLGRKPRGYSQSSASKTVNIGRRMTGGFTAKHQGQGRAASLTGFSQGFGENCMDDQIKVVNYEALPSLGGITHVVFDKTDTLTMSTMHLCQITTIEKIYKIESETKLRELMELFDEQPQEFEFAEDLEENKAKENSYYSEKSQE